MKKQSENIKRNAGQQALAAMLCFLSRLENTQNLKQQQKVHLPDYTMKTRFLLT